jgi:phosphomannomutase
VPPSAGPGTDSGLLEAAARWRDLDPDPGTRAELDELVAAARSGDAGPLAAAFTGRVGLGTAGLRAPMGPGPARMNRVVVRRATEALLTLLPADALVVVGHDARRRSAELAADVARVVAGGGRRPLLLAGPVPTPVLAFAVRHLGCGAGVMITASHNRATDNGYKVYLADGAQIGPPDEQRLAAALDRVSERDDGRGTDGTPWGASPVAPDDATTGRLVADYVGLVAGRLRPGPRSATLAYTALHGVGRAPTAAAFAEAGFPPLVEVAAQCEPDGDFPTVAFPNPEEPSALELLERRAAEVGADAGLAHDPDADRLGVLVPRGAGWASLTGDEIGVLLADHLLGQGRGPDRLVARTVVSSRLLDRVAEAHGARCVATLTGFKHVMAAVRAHPELRLVLGYEEALGFAVGDEVRDKDGIAAALVLADLVARSRAVGRTLDDRLDELARRHGLHVAASRSFRVEGFDGVAARAAAMDGLRRDPPGELAGRSVVDVVDFLADDPDRPGRSRADLVVLELGQGAWAAVRPSGTEPKLKLYGEVVHDLSGAPPAAARAGAAAELERIQGALARRLGFTVEGDALG